MQAGAPHAAAREGARAAGQPPRPRFVIHKRPMGDAQTKEAGPSVEAHAAAPHGRRAANVFIALFLLYQVLMPLSYYLGDGGYDERFSWRMFSTLRLHRCNVGVQEEAGGDVRQVALGQALQVAWVNMLKRHRIDVVEKFLHARCAEEGVSEVRYVRRCTDTDGTQLPPQRLTLDCTAGTLRDPGAEP